MATQSYNTEGQRIGKYKGQILAHAIPQEVSGRFGVKKEIPKNSGDTIILRRWLPAGATASSPNIWAVDPVKHTIQEGVTPTAETIKPQDIQATLQEIGVVYRYTNRVADLYEDDVPSEIIQLTGERMGLVQELMRLGVLRACPNAFYAGGVLSRASIVSKITPNLLRKVARSLNTNLARRITSVLDASPKVNTYPIEAAYVVLCHSDSEADLRTELPGFKHVSEYGQRQSIHENELGSWEQFRFICTPHMPIYLAGGGAVGATGLVSVGAVSVDVYPMIVLSQESYGDVALRGKSSLSVGHQPASQKTKDDPLGQRGVISASTYYTAVRLNDLQMAVVEVGVTAL